MITVVVKSKKAKLAIIAAFIIIPAIIGAFLLVRNQEKIQGYETVKAKVVDYKQKREYDYEEHYDKIWYQEVVEYAVDGKVYRATNSVWSTAPKGIGGEIKIAYDPNNPSNCIFVTNNYTLVAICFGLSLVGLILLVITLVGFSRGVTS